ncbi:DNA replication/repair protein RecF [Paraneptunicella aestuarii]|uniref:DNA replication/repair protein RecF n=1 Tax=Paraneptunicella aestuarii TaxID=2831148 RepID=UPI001E2B99ED|nr:DNA replication/repair protein RecF [Paraneptunicella aestuarii]UAA38803.1 DNA replication/repair protein RecF [Paraneptunicella aestuarii]
MIFTVQFENVRNIPIANVVPSPILNVLYGQNGSGKSSFLEALYLLSSGRSFRTTELKNLISFEKESLLVRSELMVSQDSKEKIGLSFSRSGQKLVKKNGEKIKNSSELARSLPLRFLSPTVSELVEGSPRNRRQFLDWIMFHVEPSYLNEFKTFKTVLANRNAVLKDKRKDQEAFWTEKLVELSYSLTGKCRNIVSDITPYIDASLSLFLSGCDISIDYYQGWGKEKDLAELLTQNLENEFKFGTTRYGFQRSDLRLKINGKPLNQVMSRGQLKLCAFALHLAQVRFINERNGVKCTVLIDDVISELDDINVCKVIGGFIDSGSQCFITSANDKLPKLLADHFSENYKLFHVEHGTITEEEYP